MQGAGGIGGLLASTHLQQPSTTVNNSQPSQSLFFSYDSNGNVIHLTDAQCLTAAKYKYDAFGQTLSATGPAANLNRYRFSTKPVEFASGLAFYGYRYYDPTTGRWPNRDPIEEKGGFNIYAMVSNSPTKLLDYLGKGQFDWIDETGGTCPAPTAGGHYETVPGGGQFDWIEETVWVPDPPPETYPDCECYASGGTWMPSWQAGGYADAYDCIGQTFACGTFGNYLAGATGGLGATAIAECCGVVSSTGIGAIAVAGGAYGLFTNRYYSCNEMVCKH
jgi:RHS repeat-associated protein